MVKLHCIEHGKSTQTGLALYWMAKADYFWFQQFESLKYSDKNKSL
jgi:hypothetical protein